MRVCVCVCVVDGLMIAVVQWCVSVWAMLPQPLIPVCYTCIYMYM